MLKNSPETKGLRNFYVDMRILNTMDKNTQSALTLLNERGVTLLDAARLIRNALDSFSKESGLTPVQFCAKVISTGLRHIRNDEMSIKNGFMLYLETKKNLRP